MVVCLGEGTPCEFDTKFLQGILCISYIPYNIQCVLYRTALKSGRLIGGLASRDIEWKFLQYTVCAKQNGDCKNNNILNF